MKNSTKIIFFTALLAVGFVAFQKYKAPAPSASKELSSALPQEDLRGKELVFEQKEEFDPSESPEERAIKSVTYDELDEKSKKIVDKDTRQGLIEAEALYALEKAPGNAPEAFVTADEFTDDDSNALMARALTE